LQQWAAHKLHGLGIYSPGRKHYLTSSSYSFHGPLQWRILPFPFGIKQFLCVRHFCRAAGAGPAHQKRAVRGIGLSSEYHPETTEKPHGMWLCAAPVHQTDQIWREQAYHATVDKTNELPYPAPWQPHQRLVFIFFSR